jgi:hypothetical protein
MTMTPTDIYALRTTNLLPVPEQVLDMISSMQLVPVAPVYPKKSAYKKHTVTSEKASSWRSDVIVSFKKTHFKHEDPDYNVILGITNKVSSSSLSSSIETISEILMKRKEEQDFRLRIVTMLFNRGVSMPFYSKLMANMFELLHSKFSEILDDLQYSCSIDCFHKMFEHSETLTSPSFDDPDYDDKLCKWVKSRELRRGFGMFVTELHVRGLVDNEVIVEAIKVATDELEDTVRKHNDKTMSETVDQLITLLFETCKILKTRFGKDHPTIKLITDYSKKLCEIPRSETPCLGMRSRFKLDDIQKL